MKKLRFKCDLIIIWGQTFNYYICQIILSDGASDEPLQYFVEVLLSVILYSTIYFFFSVAD